MKQDPTPEPEWLHPLGQLEDKRILQRREQIRNEFKALTAEYEALGREIYRRARS